MVNILTPQFQATMRDKDGRVLVNAHVLGEIMLTTTCDETSHAQAF
jgi:hypothetical protein